MKLILYGFFFLQKYILFKDKPKLDKKKDITE